MTPPQPGGLVLSLSGPDQRGVAELIFGSGRPANAFTIELVEAFLEVVRTLPDRDDVRTLVVRSNVSAFSGGADLGAMGEMPQKAYEHYIHTEFALFGALEELPQVTVAVLTGACIGNAAELALACDVRVADDTVRFGLPETRVGFQGPATRITRYVGQGVAKDLLYYGRLLDGARCYELGLITELAPADGLADMVDRVVAETAALPSVAIRLTKQNVHRAYAPKDESIQAEIDAALVCYQTKDFREGVAAFAERRPPVFQGR
jgi:enoyl-CoA hydratase/carnithine racemase